MSAQRSRLHGSSDKYYVGGNMGICVPLGLGRANDEIAFNDVATKGFVGNADFLWINANNIGLGAELGYLNFPYSKQFWGSTESRGTFEASYQTVQLNGVGRLLMGKQDLRPFLGVSFGANYLRNEIDFSSTYSGTSEDESVQYVSNSVKMGFAANGGIYYQVSRKCLLSLTVQLYVIPFLNAETKTYIDSYTFEERTVVLNPHGNQSHLAFTAGLQFGVGDR